MMTILHLLKATLVKAVLAVTMMIIRDVIIISNTTQGAASKQRIKTTRVKALTLRGLQSKHHPNQKRITLHLKFHALMIIIIVNK